MSSARQLRIPPTSTVMNLEDLAASGGEVIRAGSWKKAEIRRIQDDGRNVVIKDWRTVPAWLRPWATWLMAREAEIYVALAGMPGVPRLLAAGNRILAIEHVPGAPISTFMGGRGRRLALGPRLEAAVREMHERGVYHADLHYRRNILVTPEGDIGIIDFASAVDCRRLGVMGRLFRPLLALLDHYALIKWKGGVDPDSLTRRERRLLILLDTLRLKPRSRRS
ncbi:MAG: hypothetical protein ACE5IK_08685 [Acidobacteriota bacterium]